jgi:SAM-dependent MidA family methyltransferase
MHQALYGAGGFFTRAQRPGGSGSQFRTSANASELFATAVLRLLVAVDEAVGRPRTLDVVDIGAGGGHLLRHLAELAPTCLASRLALRGVDMAARPADLPERITWVEEVPAPASVTGLVVATEWLDNVPLNVSEATTDGAGATGLRYLTVDPSTGFETAGGELSPGDAAWVEQWWPAPRGGWPRGARVEIGQRRDVAWARAVAGLTKGLAVTVDYGHTRGRRPLLGTLTGYRAGRETLPVPDGTTDITAHVAMDAVRAAGEAVAARRARLTTQRTALNLLGIDGTRPPTDLATRDPEAYIRALARAGQAAELTAEVGLGGHYWLLQPVGIPRGSLPGGLAS